MNVEVSRPSAAGSKAPRQSGKIAVAVMATGFLCLLGTPSGAGDLADLKARGKLRMLSYPLLEGHWVRVDVEAISKVKGGLAEMRDPKDFSGVEVDLMMGFAKHLGVALEIRPVTAGYGALLKALGSGEGDLVASSITITSKRLETFDFSTPYFIQWMVAAVRPDSKVRTIEDLRGKKVALMEGSSQLEALPRLNLNSKPLVTEFSLQSYVAVTEGKADFTIMDSTAPVGDPVESSYPDLIVAVRINESAYGAAMRKGSDLKAALDAYLDSLRKSGELEKILIKHGQGTEVPKKRPALVGTLRRPNSDDRSDAQIAARPSN